MLEIRMNNAALMRKIEDLRANQLTFATALALTRTGQRVKKNLEGQIDQVFDRPTPYTKNSLYLQPATKKALIARVRIKDRSATAKGNAAEDYLEPQVKGGQRRQKRFEKLLSDAGIMPQGWFAVPAKGTPLDSYGNVSQGTIAKILAQLRASSDTLNREKAAAKKKRNRKARGGRYFSVYPGREETRHLRPGIYERVNFAFGSAVRPVLIFLETPPTYRKRFPFFEDGMRMASELLPQEFAAAVDRAIATAR